jgi:hypothetical protein
LKPKECDNIGDVAEFFFNPNGAVIKTVRGPKYADSKQKQGIVEIALQLV